MPGEFVDAGSDLATMKLAVWYALRILILLIYLLVFISSRPLLIVQGCL
jgi:hypothetical protein